MILIVLLLARQITIRTLAELQDHLGKASHGKEIKKALMGHAESGMTGRYSTKKQPRAVKISELNEAVQNLKWLFLGNLRSTCAR